jgi:hypothetical protein
MSIDISRREREALYEQAVIRLSGIDDVFHAVEREDWEAAERLGREYSDLLRLLCDDLGWGEASEESFTLTTPPETLARALGRLREIADRVRADSEQTRDKAGEEADESRFVQETCERILGEVGG